MCGDWFGPCRFVDALSRIGSTADLERRLHEHGFTHLMIDKLRFADFQKAPLSVGLPSDFADGFDKVFESTGCAVFALRSSPTSGDTLQ